MRTIRRFKYHLTLVIILIIILGIIIIKNKLNKNQYDDIITEDHIISDIKTVNSEEEKLCTVDIKGAIQRPGVYQLECNKYVEDIINAAGGLTENADTSTINLAKKITDEMVIIIYTKEEINESQEIISNECICPQSTNDASLNENNNLVNINTASLEELKKIPGIGESKAKAIIEYRNNFGKFTTTEDIKNVRGIGDKLYEQIKIYITT